MPARRLQVGDRVVVYGGYDMDLAWLAASPNGYSGEVVEFIPGQNSEPAAVIALDTELVLPEGAGAVRGTDSHVVSLTHGANRGRDGRDSCDRL